MRPLNEWAEQWLAAISIHAPRAGCDTSMSQTLRTFQKFQSTHPVRGATHLEKGQQEQITIFQSTHPVRGATLIRSCTFTISSVFQSTHPVRGATASTKSQHTALAHFNPRTPCGVRQGYLAKELRRRGISIHAPRAGCDQGDAEHSTHMTCYFNPRTPCGVRRDYKGDGKMTTLISIHAPRAGCDFDIKANLYELLISIHAPRAGCDLT